MLRAYYSRLVTFMSQRLIMQPLKETDIRKGFWLEALLWVLSLPLFMVFGFNHTTFLWFIGIIIIMLQNMKDRTVSKVGLLFIFSVILFVIIEIIQWKYCQHQKSQQTSCQLGYKLNIKNALLRLFKPLTLHKSHWSSCQWSQQTLYRFAAYSSLQ